MVRTCYDNDHHQKNPILLLRTEVMTCQLRYVYYAPHMQKRNIIINIGRGETWNIEASAPWRRRQTSGSGETESSFYALFADRRRRLSTQSLNHLPTTPGWRADAACPDRKSHGHYPHSALAIAFSDPEKMRRFGSFAASI